MGANKISPIFEGTAPMGSYRSGASAGEGQSAAFRGDRGGNSVLLEEEKEEKC